MTKVFITGSTGYVGGDALYALATSHPEYEITTLVRSEKSSALVAKQYPNLRIVLGDLDSTDLLREEAANADVVINTADGDHEPALQAIVDGLTQRRNATGKPATFLHITGTGLLTFPDDLAGREGEHSDVLFDDWDGLDTLKAAPDSAAHIRTTRQLLSAGTEILDEAGQPKIRTAIVCPPGIYGPGRGPVNGRSIQAYNLAKLTLERGQGFQVGKGEARWSQVHVHDLSDLFVLLTKAAVENKVEVDGKGLWGSGGYYFSENGEVAWGPISEKVVEIALAKGWIASKEIEQITAQEASARAVYGGPGWGRNSRSQAIRARKLLGWAPKGRSLEDELPYIVEGEAKLLGLL